MSIFLDKKEYRGDLFSQLEQTELFIRNHLNAEITGLQRSEHYEIPLPAIRETLVNALVHRDYSNFGRDIKLGIYDDALNIVSPGGLPNGLTTADILKGRSEIRNRVIARVFKALDYIEHIARVQQACLAAQLPTPTLSETGDFVDWELYRPRKDKVSEPPPPQKMSEKMSEKILKRLSKTPKMTIAEMAANVGTTTRTVERNLKELQESGQLKRIGADKGGYWEVQN